MAGDDRIQETVNAVYVAESRRVLATLIRLLGDFDSPRRRCTTPSGRRSSSGRATACPANPRAWLVSAGRFKAIDQTAPPHAVRLRSTSRGGETDVAVIDAAAWADPESVEDDRLRLDLHLLPPGARRRMRRWR